MSNENNSTPPKWLDPVGAFVLLTLTVAFAVISIGPYFGINPQNVDQTVAANQNAVVNNLFIAAVSFFIGGSVANRKKDDSLNVAVRSAASAATIAAAAVSDKVQEGAPT